MSVYHEHCFDPLDPKWAPAPRRKPQTLSVHPSEWLAHKALSDLLGDAPAEGYHVVETERGWEVINDGSRT